MNSIIRDGWAGRKAAQKKFTARICQNCNSTDRLQRHHIDRNPKNNSPCNIMILCQTCHFLEHLKAGDWGKGQVQMKNCVICGKEFLPKRSARAKLCGDKQCAKKNGENSARLRWG